MKEVIDFETAIGVIRAGDVFEIKKINFEVNRVKTEVERGDLGSTDKTDRKYKNKTEKTLLHIAIESNNKQAVDLLIANNADINLTVKMTRKTKTRTYNDWSGAFPFWQKDVYPVVETTTVKLAEQRGNQEIIALLQKHVASNESPAESPKP